MNNDELNRYRRKLDLPFSGIREAKAMLKMMEAKLERVSNEVTALLDDFKLSFPKNRPVYLHRSSDTAARALKWRLSGSKIYDFSNAAKSFRLVTADVIELLSQAGMSKNELTLILEFDFKKSHLNYELSYLYAEVSRLKVFIEDFEAWRKTPALV